jgi:ketosteroid isomerase-like protein
MGDDNVSLIRAIYKSFEQGDMDGVFDRLDEDIDWREPAGYFASTGGLPGHAGVKNALERYPEVWGRFDLVPETFIATGEHVFVLGSQSGEASATGREFQGRFANVWRVEGGKAVAFEAFGDTALMWLAMGEQPDESVLEGGEDNR